MGRDLAGCHVKLARQLFQFIEKNGASPFEYLGYNCAKRSRFNKKSAVICTVLSWRSDSFTLKVIRV